MIERIWIYEAEIVRPVDGDTTLVNIDQGMNHWARNQYVRYAGINAPEMSTQAGKDALAHLESLFTPGGKLYLATLAYHEYEKYGRVLAVVYTAPPTTFNWAGATLADLLPGSVNQEMIDSGHAVPYNPTNL
jgi:endonuclease YncB( thermonuclease family)